MKKNNYLSLGVMSGTSCDGIDLSLIQTDGKDRADFISSMYIKYSEELKEDLFKLINNFTESSLYSSKVIEIQGPKMIHKKVYPILSHHLGLKHELYLADTVPIAMEGNKKPKGVKRFSDLINFKVNVGDLIKHLD